MKSILKIQSITLVFLLLCSVCVAPVMAGTQTEIVEDGVHLIKSDNSPTVLDPNYAIKNKMLIGTDFVVDGNQFYWVRIGNEKTKDLSSNTIARLMCKYGLYLGALGAGGVVGAISGGAEVTTFGAATPVILPIAGMTLGFIIGIAGFSDEVCQKFEKWFINNKYQVVASDGTMLFGIDKLNAAGIDELKKDGIDIKKLTHLTKDGSKTDKKDYL